MNLKRHERGTIASPTSNHARRHFTGLDHVACTLRLFALIGLVGIQSLATFASEPVSVIKLWPGITPGEPIDAGYTSNDPKHLRYALDRSRQCIDIANALGTDLVVLWLAPEGTYLRESKSAARSVELLVQVFDSMLAHDKQIRLSIEPKPNEPMNHAYIPTIEYALAVAQLTSAPNRIGALIESAHVILAGLDPADEIDFAMAYGKPRSLHPHDQSGLKFDQDKPFGSANLRAAFNQVRALECNGY